MHSPQHKTRVLPYSIVLCAAVFFGMSAPQSASAENWMMQTDISQRGTWSSNPLMSIDGGRSLYGSTTSPELNIYNKSPDASVEFGARLDQNLFNNDKYNSTDLHQTAEITKNGQLWSAGIKERIDYDTTRTSETTNYGLTSLSVRHTGLSISPTASYKLSAIDEVSVTGAANIARYDNDALSDYETFSANSSYMRHMDPTNDLFVGARAQRYKTTSNLPVKVDSAGPYVGWNSKLSERITANASLGAQTSRQYLYGIAVTPWNLEYVFSGEVSFKDENDEATIKVERAQTPHSNGSEALQSSVSLSGKHNVTRRFSLNVGADYKKSSYQVERSGNLETWMAGRLGTSYRATETIDITTSYRYRHETLVNRDKPAFDHSVMIGLRFHPNPWTLLD